MEVVYEFTMDEKSVLSPGHITQSIIKSKEFDIRYLDLRYFSHDFYAFAIGSEKTQLLSSAPWKLYQIILSKFSHRIYI